MRKAICFVTTLLLFVACSQTDKDRAEALIKDALQLELYNPDTYKPVDTHLDSAFAPYDDPAFFDQVEALVTLQLNIQQLDSNLRAAKDTMALLTVPMSDTDEQKYEEARGKYESSMAELDEVRLKGDSLLVDIVRTLQRERRFIGYKVVHAYRADDSAGNMQAGNTVFLIDSLFSRVVYSLELTSYEKIQKIIAELKNTLVGQ